MVKTKAYYISKQQLEDEIIASKSIRKEHPDWTVAQCFTPKLTEYIQILVNRYSNKGQWRSYSYLDDMKSDAIMTLCQNIFKYDETRFNNPFGYATQIIKYCFITFLEKEEIIRDIKDSLWESIGMTPSYARQLRNEMLRDIPDQSSKAIKVLKKDAEILHAKIEMLSLIINRRIDMPDMDMDIEIANILEMDMQPFTGDLEAALSLFVEVPTFEIERDVEIAGTRVTCLDIKDKSTKSHIKRVLSDVTENTVTLALCSIALTIRRDLLVKRLREISGYNLSNTRIPTAERTITPDYETGDEGRQMPDPITPNGTAKRRGRKKND